MFGRGGRGGKDCLDCACLAVECAEDIAAMLAVLPLMSVNHYAPLYTSENVLVVESVFLGSAKKSWPNF
jgi:hypothetical protein